MKKSIEIGSKRFSTKKEALNHFRNILNAYEFGQQLNGLDFSDVMSLLDTHPRLKDKIGIGIKEIRVGKTRYDKKAFELIRFDDTTEFFSYIKRINSPKSDFTKFAQACRQIIQEDLRIVKLEYFKNYSKHGQVKCQESGELAKYEELNVDHRQPNTFSVIVDRFIEINDIDIKSVKYRIVDGAPDELLDDELADKFRDYHRQKAILRIVKKQFNQRRAFQGRIQRQKKDLRIKK